MRIGLTYDLRAEYLALGYGEEETAEFDQQGTIDSLADAIESLGHSVDRIGSARALGETAKASAIAAKSCHVKFRARMNHPPGRSRTVR